MIYIRSIYSLFFSNYSTKCKSIPCTKTRNHPSVPWTRKASTTFSIGHFHWIMFSATFGVVCFMVQNWSECVQFFIQFKWNRILCEFWRHSRFVRSILVSAEHVWDIAFIDSIGHFHIFLWKSFFAIRRTETNRAQKSRIENCIFFLNVIYNIKQ